MRPVSRLQKDARTLNRDGSTFSFRITPDSGEYFIPRIAAKGCEGVLLAVADIRSLRRRWKLLLCLGYLVFAA